MSRFFAKGGPVDSTLQLVTPLNKTDWVSQQDINKLRNIRQNWQISN